MKNTLLFYFVFVLFVSLGFGQSNLWIKTSDLKLKNIEKIDRDVHPSKFQLFQLDFIAFKQLLLTAPMENASLDSDLVIKFPDSEGNLNNFKVFEAPVMEKGLSDKFPSIRSYSAQGIDDTSVSLRFSVTDFGLHVMSISGGIGTYYIDTYTKDLNNYIVYSRKDIQKPRSFGCFVEESDSELDMRIENEHQVFVNDGNFRQYRLAISNTIEYAAYHLNAAGTPAGAPLLVKKGVVLSAMIVSLTRLNGIFEREMSLRLNLVANNDLVIFIDSDNYTNSPTMINEIQPIIDGLIGFENYDMGHGYCTTDSGIAQVSSVCSSGKARGITGNPSPVGDPFNVDYVAHEMGHQFGANHTQNNNCQRSSTSSFEPGSASTIMGYAGICAPNVQNNSNDYFHARSILEMTNFVTSGSASCRQISSRGNIAPVVSAGGNFIIPNGTAFKLTGIASDANGDALTYCWEQYNNQISIQPPLASATTGPNFRSLPPSSTPVRYFPRFSDVLNGNLAPIWEVIPNVARTMNFVLTVRDNRVGGGMTNRSDMTVTTTNVGPFRITSPALAESWVSGSSQTISWDVAGTTGNGINTANVNILISTDGGSTFSTLVANTPNDGSEVVIIPSITAVNCRILIEAVGNIFYAISPNFAIGYSLQSNCSTFTNNTIQPIPDGLSPTASSPGPTLSSVINIPISQTITDVNVTVNVTHEWIRDLVSRVVHPDGTEVILGNRICNDQNGYTITFNDGFPAVVCSAPITSGTFSPNQPLNVLNSKSTNGNWTLTINDFFQGDIGNLNSWSVEVCYLQASLITDSFGLHDFKLFPNPNNGNFTIQFNSDSKNQIKVIVHDLRGREIFNRTYENDGFFNQNLQLNDVQSGVYLVNIQDGDRKEVKKIFIR